MQDPAASDPLPPDAPLTPTTSRKLGQPKKPKTEDLTIKTAISVIDEIGRNERHFNTLQSEYRKLASGWLLAALGAIGYVLLSTASSATKTDLLFITAIGSLAGVFMLWLLDYRVYQQLLESSFSVAKTIEDRFLAKPRMRTSMAEGMKPDFVRSTISLFYLAVACAVPVCVLLTQWSLLSLVHVVVLIGIQIAMVVTLMFPWRVEEAKAQRSAAQRRMLDRMPTNRGQPVALTGDDCTQPFRHTTTAALASLELYASSCCGRCNLSRTLPPRPAMQASAWLLFLAAAVGLSIFGIGALPHSSLLWLAVLK
jgi:hypothetical protein